MDSVKVALDTVTVAADSTITAFGQFDAVAAGLILIGGAALLILVFWFFKRL